MTYEIMLHPTYRMPCLYFRLWGLPENETSPEVDLVFRHLVPDEFKESLRGYGGIGGLSVDVSIMMLLHKSINSP